MAQVFSVGVYTLLLPLALVITIAAFFIYKAFYDKHNNKVLESGETNKRKWMAPWGLALIVLGAQLLLVAGIMFPLSMFMVQPEPQEPVTLVTSDMPFSFDVSDSVQFVVDETYYEMINTVSGDGFTITAYKKLRPIDNDYYVFVGDIDKDANWPTNIFIHFKHDGEDSFVGCEITENCASEKAYFKFEVMTDLNSTGSFSIGLKNGPVGEISSLENDFDKSIELQY